MATALTRAETADFAVARAPPQAPQVLDNAPTTPLCAGNSIKRRFTVTRPSRLPSVIVETALEDAASTRVGTHLTSSSSTLESGDVKSAVGPMDFDLLCVIGQGAFGKVIQVRHVPTDEVLAMKVRSSTLRH